MSDATPAKGTPAQSSRPGARPKLPSSSELAPRPPAALYAAYSVAAAAILGAVTSVLLFFQDSYIRGQAIKSNNDAKAKDKKTGADLTKYINDQISATHKSAVIGAVIVLIALGFISFGIYKGRYWSRWGTLIVWFLASFTNTFVGIGAILGVTGSLPAALKFPSFIGALLMVVGVILTNMPSVVKWLALSKPTPPPGQPARRGLFAPRIPPPSARTAATPTTSSVDMSKPASPNASRTKKRASTASVAKGADLARTRAKAASKSRRTDA